MTPTCHVSEEYIWDDPPVISLHLPEGSAVKVPDDYAIVDPPVLSLGLPAGSSVELLDD